MITLFSPLASAFFAVAAPVSVEAEKHGLGKISPTAIIFFFVFIVLSLGITYWAARRTRTTTRFLRGGRQRHRPGKTASRWRAIT